MVEAETLDDAGPKILDQHVGLGEQPPQHLEVASILEVDRQAFLGTVDGVEDGRVAADLGVAEIEPPRQVAAIRPLDLDDAGAEVEQPERRIRPRQELAHVDDDKAGQWRFVLLRSCRYFSVLPTKSAGFLYFTVCRCSQ